MDRFISSIEKSLETENWYSAIILTLTLPDICGWLESSSTGSKKRYVAWYEKYLMHLYKNDFFGADFCFMTGRDCYALRCAFLHEGADEILRQSAREVLSKIIFSTTGSHRIRIDDVLSLNVSAFAKEVCEGVKQWETDTKDNKDIQERKKELLFINTKQFSPVPGVVIS